MYLISPLMSHTKNHYPGKFWCQYVGPLVVYRIIDPHNYLLMTLDGKLLKVLFEHETFKPAVIRTSEGNITRLAYLKQLIF